MDWQDGCTVKVTDVIFSYSSIRRSYFQPNLIRKVVKQLTEFKETDDKQRLMMVGRPVDVTLGRLMVDE